MQPDLLFRNLLLLLLLPLVAFGISFRLRVNTGEKLDRLQEGWTILVLLRLFGLAMWGTLFVWMWNPTHFAWAALGLPEWVRWLGVAVGVFGIAWLTWMFRSLGSNLTDTVVTRKAAYLVTSGPYRYVRHPMYVGVLSLSLFVMLITSNWLFGLLGGGVFLMMRLRLPIEEKNLIARFGQQYRGYMETTGRFFPKLLRG